MFTQSWVDHVRGVSARFFEYSIGAKERGSATRTAAAFILGSILYVKISELFIHIPLCLH